MTELESSILAWHKQAEAGVDFPITEGAFENALSIAEWPQAKNKADFLALLAALNLLNAAIKTPEYKDRVSYYLIKHSAVDLLPIIEDLKDRSITSFYNMKEKCLYIKVGIIIFSFHHVPLSPYVFKAGHSRPIVWGGIRLQKIAAPLFDHALAQSSLGN